MYLRHVKIRNTWHWFALTTANTLEYGTKLTQFPLGKDNNALGVCRPTPRPCSPTSGKGHSPKFVQKATDVRSNPRMKRYALYDALGLSALKDMGAEAF
jgi:hypothetical protein